MNAKQFFVVVGGRLTDLHFISGANENFICSSHSTFT